MLLWCKISVLHHHILLCCKISVLHHHMLLCCKISVLHHHMLLCCKISSNSSSSSCFQDRLLSSPMLVWVVVGLTVGSISSKTLASDCLCTLELCTASMIAYQLTIGTFGGISVQFLSKLFLKDFTVVMLTTSFGRAYQVVVIVIG